MTPEEKQAVATAFLQRIARGDQLKETSQWIDRMASMEGFDAESLTRCLEVNSMLLQIALDRRSPTHVDVMRFIKAATQALFQLGYQTAKKEARAETLKGVVVS